MSKYKFFHVLYLGTYSMSIYKELSYFLCMYSHPAVRMYHNLFNQSFYFDQHLGCFQSFKIKNTLVGNFVHVSFCICFSITEDKFLEVELQCQKSIHICNFDKYYQIAIEVPALHAHRQCKRMPISPYLQPRQPYGVITLFDLC